MKTRDHHEWVKPLLFLTVGFLFFETLTGFGVTFLPFSVSSQLIVLIHTGIGILFLFPVLWYQLRHWLLYRHTLMTHIKISGYITTGATSLALLTGLILTYQAIWMTHISVLFRKLHLISTIVFLVAILLHITPLFYRAFSNSSQKRRFSLLQEHQHFLKNTGGVLLALFAMVFLSVYAYEPVQFKNSFPADYSFVYGKDRPFAPSLATTTTGGAFDERSFNNSESCGRSGCHEQIVEEWAVSAHRYAAMDPAFQAVQKVMAEQNGPESTRYCGGCHDPISLFSGSKTIYNEQMTNESGYQEGVSCLVCHAIQETDVQGNANYTIEQPRRYLFELSDVEPVRKVTDFLIRAYPDYHQSSLQHTMFKSPEFCGACHKQFIDEEINNVGWVQLQNQYDNWRKSRWNHPGHANDTIECRECHMPLVESTDPARGDAADYNRSSADGKHRSHRFLASNQFIPELLDLPGAEVHTRMTEDWLRGEIAVPEIADKWTRGPVVPIEIVTSELVKPGNTFTIRVVLTNNKAGHNFPTGPMDIIQAWLRLRVTDSQGQILFTSGTVDEDHFIEPGSFIFKAEPVDRAGNLIDRHNLWEMVGVRYSRALFPGFSDQAEYTVQLPEPLIGPINIRADLQYRKIEQNLINFLFGPESGITAPITTIATDSLQLETEHRAQL